MKEQLTLELLDASLWYRGDLRHLLRPHRQADIYDFIHDWTETNPNSFGPIVINSHRRLGKSYLLNLLCWERCLRHPNQICRFVAPSLVQGRLYLRDIINQLIPLCPVELRPHQSGDTWTFKNPNWGSDSVSTIELSGVQASGGDALRGPRANIVVLDEVREMMNVRYIVNDVLSYQFDKQLKPLLILSSTPPHSMAHEFASFYIPEARGKKTYILAPAEKTDEAEGNPDFTEDDKRRVLEACGDEESVSWQREALCALVSDPAALIIPEFTEVKEQIVKHVNLPPWFHAFLAVDFGFQDHNGVVYGWVDFRRKKLVIAGETWMHNSSTGQLAREIQRKEQELWGCDICEVSVSTDENGKRWKYLSLVRVGDHSKQQLIDLFFDHDLHVSESDKWDFDAALANLRHGVGTGRIIFDPCCSNLIYQLKHGTWKVSRDGSRRTFSRSNVLGHCDLIAALNYLYRSVSFDDNPYPLIKHDPSTHFISPLDTEPERVTPKLMNLKYKSLLN